MSKFEVKCDVIELTFGALFFPGHYISPPADTHRRFGPGVVHYFIDGEEVTREEFERRYAEEHPE